MLRVICLRPALLLAVGLAAPLLAQTAAVSTCSPGSRIAYDRARSRLVVAPSGQSLWEWNGVHWGATSMAPFAVRDLVYDPFRRHVFLLAEGSGDLAEYDGGTWVVHPTPTALAGLRYHVADAHRGVLIAQVALAGNGATTWEWNGQWTQVGVLPPQRTLTAVAQDELRHVTVAQASTMTSPVLHETWEWNGIAWSLRLTGPQSRGSLGFDPVRQQVLGVTSAATSAWDGAAWTSLPTSARPPLPASFASDPAHGRLWAGTWAWDGAQWSEAAPSPHPVVPAPGFTYDAGRQRAVLLGGVSYLPFAHHEWDGLAWRAFSLPPQFPPRSAHAQVHDAARGETLVFGGLGGGAALGDTWAWNGAAWRLAATTGPAARSEAALAFDGNRGRVVLFGGFSLGTALQDHWEWDGTNWTLVSATTPMGPTTGAMGHDPLRARTVLFDLTSRTWEYDGVAWIQLATSATLVAPSRWFVWDGVRQRLAGELRTPALATTARHEWDGVHWTPVPAATTTGAITFDPTRGRWLDYRGDTFVTETATPAYSLAFGLPCGGGFQATALSAFGVPRPGDPGFQLDLRAEAVLRPAVLGLGLGAANVPLGNGCTFYVGNSLVSFVWFTDAEGCWHQPVRLPNDLTLRGVAFVAQAGVLDPASPGGLALTQGITVVVGD